MEIIVSSQSETNIVQLIMAIASVGAAFASTIAAFASLRNASFARKTIERLEKRDVPKVGISKRRRWNDSPEAIVVANVGAVPFTVVEVGIGDVKFTYSKPLVYGSDIPTNSSIRTVHPGDHTAFEITVPGVSGLAYVRLGDGSKHLERIDGERD